MHLCSRKKAVHSPATERKANVGPTGAAPAGPVYEEVSPKDEIELNTNQAYGPVGLWHFGRYFTELAILAIEYNYIGTNEKTARVLFIIIIKGVILLPCQFVP